MSRIRILSDALASQVAAGEVVERPAAVVRELVENSLDSGARHIEVHIQRGGAALIRVTDDGCGMDREDAMLCMERHATSKIRTKEDLASIHTLGFRGEALPSIASVSRFRLATREAGALAGTEIEIHGGKMHAVREYGGAPGTVVEARALFYNVPARRKFLRTEPTEFAHVEQQFRVHAIANPHAAFTLLRDGEVLFQLPATDDVRVRIEGLAGRELAARLLPITPVDWNGVTVRGYIGGAGLSRPTRQMQLVFLNSRPVDSPTVSYALREGYHTALMKGQHPVTFLFIEMPPEDFDINVHPAKKEVRFRDAGTVREAVVRAVSGTLAATNTIPTGHVPFMRRSASPDALQLDTAQSPALFPEREQIATTQHFAPASGSADFMPHAVAPIALTQSDQAARPMESAFQPAPAKAVPLAADFRILGVIGKLYVLMESSEGLVLMDQHAAHERVLFEQLRRAMEHEGVPAQRLLLPILLEVPPQEFDAIRRHLDTLHKLGIEAEPFGSNTFKIDAIPSFIKCDDPQVLLRAVLDELASVSSRTSALRLGEDMIATTVCRHAVKANDLLRIPELQKLLADLLVCEMPWCCPHGRPTLIQISYVELEKKFGRRAP
ncbi:MAG: DNA mismatch repair endonuclease MutL [Verrucomicrobia bacterium]|nr:DNA mismatch repair endonuclease MutL [Verrucomicrobiota bacterium]